MRECSALGVCIIDVQILMPGKEDERCVSEQLALIIDPLILTWIYNWGNVLCAMVPFIAGLLDMPIFLSWEWEHASGDWNRKNLMIMPSEFIPFCCVHTFRIICWLPPCSHSPLHPIPQNSVLDGLREWHYTNWAWLLSLGQIDECCHRKGVGVLAFMFSFCDGDWVHGLMEWVI